MIIVKSPAEIESIALACRIVAETLAALKEIVRPEISTKEIEKFAERHVAERGGVMAFKGYRGYPASICTSINNQIVHGIPSQRQIKEGDIVSIDIGVYLNGFYGDGAYTYPVGRINRGTERLLSVTEESLYIGISQATPDHRVSDISSAIQKYVESKGFSVVRTFVGHGIGRSLHEEPQVPNFGSPGQGPKLRDGMTLAIEPMINEGTYETVILSDGWTAVTADGRLSAHFEHTVAITGKEPRILTLLDN
jgi:methionyl aminopeptidase